MKSKNSHTKSDDIREWLDLFNCFCDVAINLLKFIEQENSMEKKVYDKLSESNNIGKFITDSYYSLVNSESNLPKPITGKFNFGTQVVKITARIRFWRNLLFKAKTQVTITLEPE
jgi:hypothetical protein